VFVVLLGKRISAQRAESDKVGGQRYGKVFCAIPQIRSG